MFRKRLLQKFKDSRLPDDFFLYVEDMQWCMEIRKMGYKIAFLPDAQVIHFLGASGGHKNKMIDENFTTFMRQYYSSWRRSIILFLNKLLA
jgi:GT2 family glycosyltransferase